MAEKSKKVQIDTGNEQNRTKLTRGLEDLQNRERGLNSQKIIDQNKLKETKSRLLQELFRMMEELGVDPNNLESISQFLQVLDAQSSDLRELFEVAFNNLTSEMNIPTEAPEATEEGAGLMDKYQNLAPETLMPR